MTHTAPKQPHVSTYNGKPLVDMTKAELIALVEKIAQNQVADYAQYRREMACLSGGAK